MSSPRSPNTIDENLRIWDREYAWPDDGDEWRGQADFSGIEYEDWKRSLVETLLVPNCRDADVLEIGAGRGRWSAEIMPHCRTLTLSDLSASCLDFCRQRFAQAANVRCELSDGTSLPKDLTGSVDFVWSFDAFVHIGPPVVSAYMAEIARVLRPGGRAVIHHAGRRHWSLPLRWLRRLGPPGTLAFRALSMGLDERIDGWRANVSPQLVAAEARRAGLVVDAQFREWSPGYGVPRFRDAITSLHKPD